MDQKFLIGFDIGGTKCAIILGASDGNGKIKLLARSRFPTANFLHPEACIREMIRLSEELLNQQKLSAKQIYALGISCGGPLDSNTGMILSPPNLPGWDRIPIVAMLEKHFHCPVRLQNDANAGAVAEWKYGAGRGAQSLVFLTFGTGCGAGLILDGKLYAGCCGLAGECGHIRLAPFGPAGFGKAGSFEGFCSGGGLAQLATIRAREQLQMGNPPEWCPSLDAISTLTAQSVAEAALAGDELAIAVYHECGTWLGRGLAVIVDLLNPELIVIGSIYARTEILLRPAMENALRQEALPVTVDHCRIIPAMLGEKIGDYAALAVAEGGF